MCGGGPTCFWRNNDVVEKNRIINRVDVKLSINGKATICLLGDEIWSEYKNGGKFEDNNGLEGEKSDGD